MSQSVPFERADESVEGLGEAAPARRQRSDAALNRAKIIDAARRLLADNGDASMRSIADAAGLGRGTVHRHFQTREELMEAVRRQARDDADADEEDYLRPPGELANVSNTPLSVADVLNKVAPFQLGEQIVAEAQRLPGVSSAALYVVDLDGASMQRLAGAATFPAQITVPLAVGPEIPREGVAAIRAVFAELLPGATVAPLQLRSRAIGVLLAVGTASDQLRDLASEAAIALSIAPAYTDHIDTVRHTRQTSPAAEIQQNLLPPRIARVGGATLAETSCPGMRSAGTGLTTPRTPGHLAGIADSAGIGAAAAGIGAATLGAFRSVRRDSDDPAESLLAMHKVLLELADGRPPPRPRSGTGTRPRRPSVGNRRRPGADPRHRGRAAQDAGRRAVPQPRSRRLPGQLTTNTIRLDKTERLLLLSDSLIGPTLGLGLAAIERAIAKADNNAAPATLAPSKTRCEKLTQTISTTTPRSSSSRPAA